MTKPPRWDHLLAEHERQAVQREADAIAAQQGQGWGRRFVLTMLGLIGFFVVGAFCWYGLEQSIRDDPSRCPPRPGTERSELYVGGWGESDVCEYFDADGVRIGTPDHAVGPVTRTYGDVIEDNKPALALTTAVVVAATAAAIHHRRQHP